MKKQSISPKATTNPSSLLAQKLKELATLRLERYTQKLKNPRQIFHLRKEIARLLTQLRLEQLSAKTK